MKKESLRFVHKYTEFSFLCRFFPLLSVSVPCKVKMKDLNFLNKSEYFLSGCKITTQKSKVLFRSLCPISGQPTQTGIQRHWIRCLFLSNRSAQCLETSWQAAKLHPTTSVAFHPYPLFLQWVTSSFFYPFMEAN